MDVNAIVMLNGHYSNDVLEHERQEQTDVAFEPTIDPCIFNSFMDVLAASWPTIAAIQTPLKFRPFAFNGSFMLLSTIITFYAKSIAFRGTQFYQ